jgi:2-oxoisovalerate dehydrogenase E2 component (dihydrolipoyl transacylase)
MSEYIFKLPDLGEGTVESEIAEWYVAVGDLVKEEDVVGTMMTDKAAVELSSPVTGTVTSLAGEAGDTVAVGAPLVVFETAANGADSAAEVERSASASATTAVESTLDEPEPKLQPEPSFKQGGKIVTSPAVRRRAREANIDLAQVPGSGAGGRILRKDLDGYLQQQLPKQGAFEDSGGTTEIKVIGLRRMIAERMTSANLEIPHFSYVEEIDITELEALRKHLNSKKSASGERLTLLPFLCLALVRALKIFPQCNTTHDRDRGVLIRHESVNIGIATQTPDGLKVPVVRNSEQRTVENLAAEIRRVSEAARTNKIKRDELSGSSITITSLGKLGGIVSTPVINQPEVSIIGVNRAVERPMVVDGQVEIRLMMNLSSSFDHRFVDGYDAAAMIQHMKELLEHPARIFMSD